MHFHKKLLILSILLFVILVIFAGGFFFITKRTESSTNKNKQLYANSNCYTGDAAFNEIGKDTCVIFYVNNVVKSPKGNIFLNANKEYKKGFSVTIYANDLNNFTFSPTAYNNENIMVSGVIKKYEGHPEIIVTDQSYIKPVQVR